MVQYNYSAEWLWCINRFLRMKSQYQTGSEPKLGSQWDNTTKSTWKIGFEWEENYSCTNAVLSYY